MLLVLLLASFAGTEGVHYDWIRKAWMMRPNESIVEKVGHDPVK